VLSHEHEMLNALTVDVEDYFHTEALASLVRREQWDEMPPRVLANTRRLLELLAKHDVRATFFFLGWVAEHFPQLVRETAQAGHELGCHSYWHRPIYRLSPAEFCTDTQQAKRAIEDAAGVPVRGYRAPSFSLVPGTEWAAEILAELGFSYDSSVYPIRHDLYGNHSAPRQPHRIASGALLELPVATLRFGGTNLPVGGGGYLRLLPYTYTRWGLTRLNQREGLRAIVYLHPWEIDPEQPRLRARWKSRLRQYTALRQNEQKIERLLRDFRFASAAQVFQRDIRNTPSAKRSASDLQEAPVAPNPGNQACGGFPSSRHAIGHRERGAGCD
jgi:polysaccharide deacetylase family protein (PEP-CTERM system associated)